MEDVKEQAEQTAIDSSVSEETTQDQAQTAESADVADPENQAVPYSRFKEVNEELKNNRGTVEQLQKKLGELESRFAPQQQVNPQVEQVKQQLKDLGFIDRSEVDRMNQQQQENMRIASQLEKLEGQYDGKDGRPKFDRKSVVEFALSQGIGNPETAYKALHEKDLMNWHIQQAISKSGGTKSEASDGSGSSQAAGTSDQDLKTAIGQGDKSALRTYLKRFAPK